MARATLWFILVLVVAPRCAAGFACNYPTQRLTGLADIGRRGSFVKLDLTVRVIGPECEVLIDGGLLRCSRVGSRTLGVRFASTARGRCPGSAGRITDGSYTPRSELAEPTLADVTLEARLENGSRCTISGVSPRFSLGGVFLGPLPSLFGHMTCQTRSGSPLGAGTVQLLRRPLPASGSVQ